MLIIRISVLGYLDVPVALAWSGYIEDRSIVGAIKMPTATNLKEFFKYAAMLDASAEAITFATIDNHIGFIVSGKIPKRNDIENSVLFRDGTNKSHDWNGYVPENEMPLSIDPEQGYIVSCNNKITPRSMKGGIGTTGVITTRSIRASEMIQDLIKRKVPIDENIMMKMQIDTVDLFAKQVLPLLLNIADKYSREYLKHYDTAKRDTYYKLTRILRAWNYDTSANSTGALVYHVWTNELKKTLLNKFFPEESERVAITNIYYFVHFFGRLIKAWSRGEDLNSNYCDDSYENELIPSCPYNIITTLLITNVKITSSLGTNQVMMFNKNLG